MLVQLYQASYLGDLGGLQQEQERRSYEFKLVRNKKQFQTEFIRFKSEQ